MSISRKLNKLQNQIDRLKKNIKARSNPDLSAEEKLAISWEIMSANDIASIVHDSFESSSDESVGRILRKIFKHMVDNESKSK